MKLTVMHTQRNKAIGCTFYHITLEYKVVYFSLWLSDDTEEGEAVFDGKEVEEMQEEGDDVGKSVMGEE